MLMYIYATSTNLVCIRDTVESLPSLSIHRRRCIWEPGLHWKSVLVSQHGQPLGSDLLLMGLTRDCGRMCGESARVARSGWRGWGMV